MIDGYTIKYHTKGKTIWFKGKKWEGRPDGYWEWYRIDGTLKRSGYFEQGEPTGEWTTYDQAGKVYKVANKKNLPLTEHKNSGLLPLTARLFLPHQRPGSRLAPSKMFSWHKGGKNA